ncbi:MAG: hypothetical protein A3E84_04075 [Gammaproteobacteria bacterium RIFCSPHIGHO2_12_FULL_42_13]|nr:MAG: hypothetical protein A3E84_04075 [Gammaproteobacteria bacterium RIFCSPHIGHO2_12_FULL_42_13]
MPVKEGSCGFHVTQSHIPLWVHIFYRVVGGGGLDIEMRVSNESNHEAEVVDETLAKIKTAFFFMTCLESGNRQLSFSTRIAHDPDRCTEFLRRFISSESQAYHPNGNHGAPSRWLHQQCQAYFPALDAFEGNDRNDSHSPHLFSA